MKTRKLKAVTLILTLAIAVPAIGQDGYEFSQDGHEKNKVYFKADTGLLTGSFGTAPVPSLAVSASAELAGEESYSEAGSGRLTSFGLGVSGEVPLGGEDSGRKPRYKVEVANGSLLRFVPFTVGALLAGSEDLAFVALLATGEIEAKGASGEKVTIKLKDNLYIESNPLLGRNFAIGAEWEGLIRKESVKKGDFRLVYLVGAGLKTGYVDREDGGKAEITASATGGAGVCALLDKAEEHKLCLEGKLKVEVGYLQAGATGETGVYYTGVADKDENGHPTVLFTASATAFGAVETSSAGTYKDIRPLGVTVGGAF